MVTLHHALEALAAAGPDDVHALAIGENRDVHVVARLRRLGTGLDAYLAADPRGRHAGLLEVAGGRLVLLGGPVHQAELYGLVAVALDGLDLGDHAWARLDHRRRLHGAVGREDLRHPDFLANQSCHHFVDLRPPATGYGLRARAPDGASTSAAPHPEPGDSLYFPCSLPNALISTSTPAGRSSFISASTVWGVGSKMSIRRLCVRISNCSRDFLSTCGDRSTVHLFFSVGSGTGPARRAPVRFAVSTISVVD